MLYAVFLYKIIIRERVERKVCGITCIHMRQVRGKTLNFILGYISPLITRGIDIIPRIWSPQGPPMIKWAAWCCGKCGTQWKNIIIQFLFVVFIYQQKNRPCNYIFHIFFFLVYSKMSWVNKTYLVERSVNTGRKVKQLDNIVHLKLGFLLFSHLLIMWPLLP